MATDINNTGFLSLTLSAREAKGYSEAMRKANDGDGTTYSGDDKLQKFLAGYSQYEAQQTKTGKQEVSMSDYLAQLDDSTGDRSAYLEYFGAKLDNGKVVDKTGKGSDPAQKITFSGNTDGLKGGKLTVADAADPKGRHTVMVQSETEEDGALITELGSKTKVMDGKKQVDREEDSESTIAGKKKEFQAMSREDLSALTTEDYDKMSPAQLEKVIKSEEHWDRIDKLKERSGGKVNKFNAADKNNDGKETYGETYTQTGLIGMGMRFFGGPRNAEQAADSEERAQAKREKTEAKQNAKIDKALAESQNGKPNWFQRNILGKNSEKDVKEYRQAQAAKADRLAAEAAQTREADAAAHKKAEDEITQQKADRIVKERQKEVKRQQAQKAAEDKAAEIQRKAEERAKAIETKATEGSSTPATETPEQKKEREAAELKAKRERMVAEHASGQTKTEALRNAEEAEAKAKPGEATPQPASPAVAATPATTKPAQPAPAKPKTQTQEQLDTVQSSIDTYSNPKNKAERQLLAKLQKQQAQLRQQEQIEANQQAMDQASEVPAPATAPAQPAQPAPTPAPAKPVQSRQERLAAIDAQISALGTDQRKMFKKQDLMAQRKKIEAETGADAVQGAAGAGAAESES